MVPAEVTVRAAARGLAAAAVAAEVVRALGDRGIPGLLPKDAFVASPSPQGPTLAGHGGASVPLR
jgi:hypothetical protein